MKNTYIILLILLTYTTARAQMSVRNSAYVFVKDQIIYVEDDVNLNETNSKIYLRSEGQLIQGSGTTGNSGVGELSTYQNGNVGAYEYNYWCSPIGDNSTNNTTNNVFGISFLNDITDLTTSTQAGFTHASNYNGTASPLNIEPYWIWKFITSDVYAEWIHVEGNNTINPGEGFTMKGTEGTSANNTGDNQNYDFRGKPNTGTISTAVLTEQFTLVGNPYPSALDAHAYIHDTNNASIIDGTLYFWEQNPNINSHVLKNYDGGYATYTISLDESIETYVPATFYTYNIDGSINSSTGNDTEKRPYRYIPVGQGFMVVGASDGNVEAKNSHRIYKKESGTDSEFFRSSSTKEKSTTNSFNLVPEDYKRFRLNIDFNDTYTRQLVETFHPTATTDFDYGLESNMNGWLASDAYLLGNYNYLIAEALPFDESLKIPFEVYLNEETNLRIRIADVQYFDNAQPIYVHDIEKDIYTDLRENNFETNLDTGYYSNRFEITFTKSTLNINSITVEDFKIFQNNYASELTIYNENHLNIDNILLFDISGKKVLDIKPHNTNNEYLYSTKNLTSGVYIAKVSSNNKTTSKKVVIHNK